MVRYFFSFLILGILLIINSLPLRGQERECHINILEKKERSGLIFISDTQQPIWIESLWLEENENYAATMALFKSIAEEKPLAVFHGGDLVAFGFSESDWQDFNRAREPLTNLAIPLYPTRGNHELLFFKDRAERLYQKEFGQLLPCRWMTIVAESMGVIMLDSNFSKMSAEQIAQQNIWLEKELALLEKDLSVVAIIFLTHHSPFTNSTIVSASTEVQKYFLPSYLASSKARLMVTGHAHAFEHFRHKEKDFLVIGGGGGLLQPLDTGPSAKYLEHSPYKTSRRFFHYLEVKIKDSLLGYTLFKMVEGKGKTREIIPDKTVFIR